MGGTQSATATNVANMTESVFQSAQNQASYVSSTSSSQINNISIVDVQCGGDLVIGPVTECNSASTTVLNSNTAQQSNQLQAIQSQELEQVATALNQGGGFGTQQTDTNNYMSLVSTASQQLSNESTTNCATAVSQENNFSLENIQVQGNCTIDSLDLCNNSVLDSNCTAEIVQDNFASIEQSQSGSQTADSENKNNQLMIIIVVLIVVVVAVVLAGVVIGEAEDLVVKTAEDAEEMGVDVLPMIMAIFGVALLGLGVWLLAEYGQCQQEIDNFATCGGDCQNMAMGWAAGTPENEQQYDWQDTTCFSTAPKLCAGENFPGTTGSNVVCVKDSDCPVGGATKCLGNACKLACDTNADCYVESDNEAFSANVNTFCTTATCSVGVCQPSSSDVGTGYWPSNLSASSTSDGSDGSGGSQRQYTLGVACKQDADCVDQCLEDTTCRSDPGLSCESNADCAPQGQCVPAACVIEDGEEPCPLVYVDPSSNRITKDQNGDYYLAQSCAGSTKAYCTNYSLNQNPVDAFTKSFPMMFYFTPRIVAPTMFMSTSEPFTNKKNLPADSTTVEFWDSKTLCQPYNLRSYLGLVDSRIASGLSGIAATQSCDNQINSFLGCGNGYADICNALTRRGGNASGFCNESDMASCLNDTTYCTNLEKNTCPSLVRIVTAHTFGGPIQGGNCMNLTTQGIPATDLFNVYGPKLFKVQSAPGVYVNTVSNTTSQLLTQNKSWVDLDRLGEETSIAAFGVTLTSFKGATFTEELNDNCAPCYPCTKEGFGEVIQNEMHGVIKNEDDVYAMHTCGGNLSNANAFHQEMTVFEPVKCHYPLNVDASVEDAKAFLKWGVDRLAEMFPNNDIQTKAENSSYTPGIVAFVAMLNIDDLQLYDTTMVNYPVMSQLYDYFKLGPDGVYHEGLLYLRQVYAPTMANWDALDTWKEMYNDVYQVTGISMYESAIEQAYKDFFGTYPYDGGYTGGEKVSEFINNDMAKFCAFAFTRHAQAGAMKWRDQIQDMTIEAWYLKTQDNIPTHTVNDIVPTGVMQTPSMGNNSYQTFAQNFLSLRDCITSRVGTNLTCSSDVESAEVPGLSTSFNEAFGISDEYNFLNGGAVNLPSGNDQAKHVCFNAALIVQGLGSPTYMGMGGLVDQNVDANVQFEKQTLGRCGGKVCADKNPAVAGSDSNASGPCDSEDDCQTLDIHGDELLDAATASYRSVDIAPSFWYCALYSIGVGQAADGTDDDTETLNQCMQAMGGSPSQLNPVLQACMNDYLQCPATCGALEYIASTYGNCGLLSRNSALQQSPAAELEKGYTVNNVIGAALNSQGTSSPVTGFYLPKCHAGAVQSGPNDCNAKAMQPEQNLTDNACCVPPQCPNATSSYSNYASNYNPLVFPTPTPNMNVGFAYQCSNDLSSICSPGSSPEVGCGKGDSVYNIFTGQNNTLKEGKGKCVLYQYLGPQNTNPNGVHFNGEWKPYADDGDVVKSTENPFDGEDFFEMYGIPAFETDSMGFPKEDRLMWMPNWQDVPTGTESKIWQGMSDISSNCGGNTSPNEECGIQTADDLLSYEKGWWQPADQDQVAGKTSQCVSAAQAQEDTYRGDSMWINDGNIDTMSSSDKNYCIGTPGADGMPAYMLAPPVLKGSFYEAVKTPFTSISNSKNNLEQNAIYSLKDDDNNKSYAGFTKSNQGCQKNEHCQVPLQDLKTLYGYKNEENLPWYLDVSPDANRVLCIGGEEDDYWTFVNGGTVGESTSLLGLGYDNTSSEDENMYVDANTTVQGACVLPNPTMISQYSPYCMAGSQTPCWSAGLSCNAFGGAAAGQYCGTVKPFLDASLNSYFTLDMDVGCSDENPALFCDTTSNACRRGIQGSEIQNNSPTAGDLSDGCQFSASDRAFFCKTGWYGSALDSASATPNLAVQAYTAKQFVDDDTTSYNLVRGPPNLSISSTIQAQGDDNNVTGQFTFGSPSCTQDVASFSCGSPATNQEYGRCMDRSSCYVTGENMQSQNLLSNRDAPGYYTAATAALQAGARFQESYTAAVPPMQGLLVAAQQDDSLKLALQDSNGYQKCVTVSAINACGGGSAALEDEDGNALYLGDPSASVLPAGDDFATFDENNFTWPRAMTTRVAAGSSQVLTNSSSDEQPAEFVDLCASSPCFAGTSGRPGLCATNTRSDSTAEHGACMTKDLCISTGNEWKEPEEGNGVAYGCSTKNLVPTDKDTLKAMLEKLDIQGSDNNWSLYKAVCALAGGVAAKDTEESDDPATFRCAFRSCFSTLQGGMGALAQTGYLQTFALDSKVEKYTFFVRRKSTTTNAFSGSTFILPGTQAWVTGCPGMCDGVSSGDGNTSLFSFPSALVFYTTGVPVNLMGKSGLSPDSTTCTTYLVAGIICLVVGAVVVVGAALMIKKGFEQGQKGDPLAAVTNSAVDGVFKGAGDALKLGFDGISGAADSAAKVAGSAVNTAGNAVKVTGNTAAGLVSDAGKVASNAGANIAGSVSKAATVKS